MNDRISAAEFASTHGLLESAVVHRIKSGIYDGGEEDGVWYVIRRRSSAEPVPAPLESVPRLVEARPCETKKVAHYTNRAYVNSIMILTGGFVLFDFVSLVFSGDTESIRGIGLRVGVFVLLWTRHRWARLSVQIWAGFFVVVGAFGLFWLFGADPAEYTVAWWGPLLFGSFIVVGLGYLLTAHRFIKVEEVPA